MLVDKSLFDLDTLEGTVQQTFHEAFFLRLLDKSEPLKCKIISKLNMYVGTFVQSSFHRLFGECPAYLLRSGSIGLRFDT